MSEEFSIENGVVCEWGKPISNERILVLLIQSNFNREDLSIARSRINNLEIQLHHFRSRHLKLTNGIKDCVGGHDDLKKFAKKMGVL